MIRGLVTYLFVLLLCNLSAQSDNPNTLTLVESFRYIETKFDISIYYLAEYIPSGRINVDTNIDNVSTMLDKVLIDTDLSYLNYNDFAYIIAPRDRIDRDYDLEYFIKKEETSRSPDSAEGRYEEYSVGSVNNREDKGSISIKGFVTNDASEEALIGVTILVKETGVGTITDEIGRYDLNLPTGEHTLVINMIGYVEKTVKVKVYGSDFLDLKIAQEAIRLGEVVISAAAQNENISSKEIGLEALSISEITKLPSFLGEADVMKSLLMLPGVSSVGEGSGGINVRGGTVDQNLIMQDGMYLFNTSHVLGLFSLFNSDVVKNVTLYKGSMPARYGGRLSSVLDVELKEGNYQRFAVKGGLGLISSRLTVESPIVKGQSSIIAGGRFSFSDYMFDIVDVANLKESSAFFYDSNIKFTQRIKNRGKISISAYTSRDRFKFGNEFDFRWRTSGVSAEAGYVASDNLSFNLQAICSRFSSSWDEPIGNRAFHLDNSIQYIKFRPETTFKPFESQTINLGIEVNNYRVKPGEIFPTTSTSITTPEKVETEKGRDFSFYINDDIELNENISFSLGLRYVIYQSLGPGDISIYEENTPKTLGSIIGTQTYANDDVIASYSGLEPRASLKLGIDQETSAKFSYNRTQQFLNQLSNTTAVSPVDIWQLSNPHIKPVTANNYSIGFFKNLNDNQWETSLELFYRDIDNLIEYKDLADLLVNTHLETEVIEGEGRAYGAELSIRKKQGRWTGRFGYTYSRTERRTNADFLEERINDNEWFLSNFDRPNDLSLVLSYQANQRNHFAINFVYSSGRPITAPVGSFSTDNIFNISIYSDRNTFRIPSYHRLDISYTIGKSHRKTRQWKGSWTFSIFNVYARKNPFSVFFTQKPSQSPKANRLSVLGSMIPSITYNFSL
ncbi:MAG: hypothetical protein ACI9FN_003610 [Saprospiraceae bacterium]|jgi:hypothetical protein